MTVVVNIHEAKTQLSKLIAMTEQGETVVISRNGTPAARLVPATRKPGPVFGLGKSQFPALGPEAFDPLPDEDAQDWY